MRFSPKMGTMSAAILTAQNSSKGISRENIDKILSGNWERKKDQNDNNGIGMDNVISRLRLFTENDNAVEIKSEGENKGCEVVIRLPFEEKEE